MSQLPTTTSFSTAAIAGTTIQRKDRRTLVLLFLALMLVVPLAGMTVLALYTPEIRQDTYANLQAIARLKAEQLENWLNEREGDAQVLMSSETASSHMRLLAQGKMEPALRTALEQYLAGFVKTYHYSELKVFRSDGKVLLSVGGGGDSIQPELLADLRTMRNGRVLRSNLYLEQQTSGESHPHIHWVVPMGGSVTKGMPPIVGIALIADARDFVFPLVQNWPTASPSGETLLVRQVGDRALFMNDLRHQSGTAMRLAPSMATARDE